MGEGEKKTSNTKAGTELGIGPEREVNLEAEVQFFDNLVWLNSEEAARYLRRSVGQLRNMVYRRQLESKKFCRRLYFRRTDLDKAVERSKFGGRSWQ